MNRKETEVLALIRQNPFMSQQEMAERLGISRPTLANLISSMIRDGKVLGRAYVLPEEETIICIGGANIDRKFRMTEPAKLGTSNPASVSQSVGGVARNIAENLGRLGHDVKLLSIAGRDSEWQMIEETSRSFINLELTETVRAGTTGTYTAVLEPNGELLLAMADMAIFDLLTPAYVARYENMLLAASFLLIDLNCPAETIRYVQELALSQNIPLAVIPVSSPKIARLGQKLNGITWFICNRDEAEAYLGTEITTEKEWMQAVQELLGRGAENVIITAGDKGVMAGNEQGIARFEAVQTDGVADVTGAGDAFSAAIIHSFLKERSFSDIVKSGLVNAMKTLQSTATVRNELTATTLQNEMEEIT